MTEISINSPLCSGCKTCTEVCPYFILKMDEFAEIPTVDPLRIPNCCHCGHCEAVCPEGAITVNYPGAGQLHKNTENNPITPVQIGQHLMMRRSIRDYTHELVPEETLRQILEIIRYAPTGMNGQPVHWLVMRDPAEIHHLAGTIIEWGRDVVKNQPGHPLAPILPMIVDAWEHGADPVCHNAPGLVIAHGQKENPNAFIDSVIAMTHLDLVAPSFGLGTCWAGFVQIAADASPEVARALHLPEGYRSQCAMLVGYPKFRFQRIPKRDALKVTWR
jgi:nitroreductase/NAD-dependent dihydropyrimidine dehydrogenase PreA subunit